MLKNKYLLIIALSLIGSLVLAACGGNSAPEPAQTQAPQSTSVSAPATEAPQETLPNEAPTEPAAEAPAATISFANDVLPIIESRCFNCHGGERVEEGLRLGSYDELLVGSDNGAVIVPGDAANSSLVELVANQKMPKRGPKLTPPQVQLITDWVNSGAPNN